MSASGQIITDAVAEFVSDATVYLLADGAISVGTSFIYGDGDGYPIIFEREGDHWYITDRGMILGRTGNPGDEINEAARDLALKVATVNGITLTEHTFVIPTEGTAVEMAYDIAHWISFVATLDNLFSLEEYRGP